MNSTNRYRRGKGWAVAALRIAVQAVRSSSQSWRHREYSRHRSSRRAQGQPSREGGLSLSLAACPKPRRLVALVGGGASRSEEARRPDSTVDRLLGLLLVSRD